MTDRIRCEFYIVQYVPDPVRGEFINIGVLLRQNSSSAGAPSAIQVRFTKDWSRVLSLDPDADVALLEAVSEDIATRLNDNCDVAGGEILLKAILDSFSSSITISDPRATLAETVPSELDQLMQLYVSAGG